MKPGQRRWVFLVAMAGVLAFYLWGLVGLPGFGHYPGPYGDILNAITVAQTHATGVVSAVNFEYRGFDTVGEEFILFAAATGVSTILRVLREEGDQPAADEARGRQPPPTSDAVRLACLAFTGPTLVLGWYLTSHARPVRRAASRAAWSWPPPSSSSTWPASSSPSDGSARLT